MANSNETIGENIENEILSQDDQISRNGGVNVSLEDFLTSATTTIHNKTILEEAKNNNLIYTDDSKNNFENFEIEESINLNIDERVNNNELLSSTSNDKLTSDNNTNFLSSNDVDTNNIMQNRTIDEVKILDSNISYNASNILKDMEIISESDTKIETKQTNNNEDTTSKDTQSTDSSEEISNTKVTLTNIESSSDNETEEETTQAEDEKVTVATETEEVIEISETENEKIETKEDEEITETEDAKVETTQTETEDESSEAQDLNEVVSTKDDIQVEEQIDNIKEKNPNNGKGNGDQDAPGNSLEHNNAENAIDDSYKLSDHIEFNIDNIIVEQKEISKEEQPQEIFIHEVMNIPENNSSFDHLSNKKESISNNHNNESEKPFINNESFSGFEEMHRLIETHIHVD